MVLVCVFCPAAYGQPWDGNGVEGDPYQIWTGEQMNSIGLYPNRWSKSYKLMADISLSAYSGWNYNRIGISGDLYKGAGPFKGTFDGDYHSISDFSCFATAAYLNAYIGLFGYVYDGTIKNLKVIAGKKNLINLSLSVIKTKWRRKIV
ncbi:hypothetical protein ES703_124796 [subsurface metagenome]